MKSEIMISEIRQRGEGEINPVIVEFQNGDLNDDYIGSLNAKLLPHGKSTDKVVEVSSSDGHKFFNNSVNNCESRKSFLAIRNKKTNKVRLVEITFTTLIHSLYLKENEKRIEEKSFKEQTAILKRLFGTKRSVRNLENSETFDVNKTSTENQIKELLNDTNVKESSINVGLDEDKYSNLIPICNRNANCVSDVYQISDLLSEEELTSLLEVADSLLKKDASEFSDFLKHYIDKVYKFSDNREKRVACLLYADALVNYLKAQARDLKKISTTLCPYSKLIGSKIIKNFCIQTGSSLNRPLAMKDKAICYIIILLLIACDFKIDLEVLAKQSGYGFKKIKQLGRMAGIVPESKTSTVHALMLPLPPPLKVTRAIQKKNK